jgi:hypothetical protein
MNKVRADHAIFLLAISLHGYDARYAVEVHAGLEKALINKSP